jgi:cell division protein FtsQ
VNRKISTRDKGERAKGYQGFLLRVFVITLVPITLAGAIFLCLSLRTVLKRASFLRLKEVTLEGNNRVSRSEVLTVARLTDETNTLFVDIGEVSRRLTEHPWIEQSTVKRIFPDGIRIVIRERNPMALVRLERLYYLDEKGKIFDQAKASDETAYPVLTGLCREDLEKRDEKACRLLQTALHLLELTREVKILPYRSISQIHLDQAIGLLVITKDRGIKFHMGFNDFEGKFQRLSQIWRTIQSLEPSRIDCTIPNRIIVQPKRVDTMNTLAQGPRTPQSQKKGGE